MALAEHPKLVEEYLQTELLDNLIVQVPHSYRSMIHCSRFGVVPKANHPTCWHLILDLSYSDGFSITDGIAPELCSIAYTIVDAAVSQKGAHLTKINIEPCLQKCACPQ